MNVISKIGQVQHYCSEHESCRDCIYLRKVAGIVGSCRIEDLLDYLSGTEPKKWDPEKVERFLNG